MHKLLISLLSLIFISFDSFEINLTSLRSPEINLTSYRTDWTCQLCHTKNHPKNRYCSRCGYQKSYNSIFSYEGKKLDKVEMNLDDKKNVL